jgi:hypothetical protein
MSALNFSLANGIENLLGGSNASGWVRRNFEIAVGQSLDAIANPSGCLIVRFNFVRPTGCHPPLNLGSLGLPDFRIAQELLVSATSSDSRATGCCDR